MKWRLFKRESSESVKGGEEFLLQVLFLWAQSNSAKERTLWNQFANRLRYELQQGKDFSLPESRFVSVLNNLDENIKILATWKNEDGHDFGKISLEIGAMIDNLFKTE